MLMMCWFYCLPFAWALFYALGPALLVLGAFMMKRAQCQGTRRLWQMGFGTLFVAGLVIFILDAWLLDPVLLFAGVPAAGAVGFILRHFYKHMPFRRSPPKTPAQMRLELWANISFAFVMVLVVWVLAPWVGYLTVGHVPALFLTVPWKMLAIVNIALMGIAFWKLEECRWHYDTVRRKHSGRKIAMTVWTPKDTLWTSVVFFVIALAFSYASNDVITQ